MKRRLLAILLAVAMLATSFVALPVFAASDNYGTIDIPLNKDSQIDFSKAYTGIVTVSFDFTLSAPAAESGDFGTDLYLPIQGNDRLGTAKPYLQITKEGALYAQGANRITSIAADTVTPIVWVYDCAAGTYTVSVNGVTYPSQGSYTCGAQDNVGALAYKTRLKTATIANLTVSVETGEEVDEVSASIVGEETVVYDNDVTFDVVLSQVVDLNVLTLGFEFDSDVLTFKEIQPTQEGLELLTPLGVNQEDGLISAFYGVKNKAITADDDTVWATLVFESVEPGEEGVSATVEMTHFTASGLVDNGADAVQYETSVEVASATTKIVLPEPEDYTVSGTVSGVEEDTVVNVSLYAEGASEPAYNTTVTGSGSYSIADVLPGTYTIKAVSEGYEEYTATVTVADSDVTHDITMTKEVINITVNCIGDIDYTVSGNVVTVDHEVACKVGYLVEDAYVAIAATENGDGTYSFTAPAGVTQVLLVVKGDATGDGNISLADSTRTKAAYNRKATLSAEALFAADATGDGAISLADSTRIKAAYNRKTTLSW